MTSIPQHVAIIPDGNRRWAKARNLEPWEGHQAGAKNTEELIRTAQELGIKELSIWGSSLENLTKRPLDEKLGLLKVYAQNLEEVLTSEEVESGKVHIRFIGRFRDIFPKPLLEIISAIEEKTKNNTEYFLNFFLAYSGDDDMLSAVEKLVASGNATVTKEDMKNALMSRELLPVDYLIRTGGDPHLSTGFMMWDTANAELFFTDRLFPDFGKEAFIQAIEEYKERARRGGK
jgi:undecaprenyl diphosphate synthase